MKIFVQIAFAFCIIGIVSASSSAVIDGCEQQWEALARLNFIHNYKERAANNYTSTYDPNEVLKNYERIFDRCKYLFNQLAAGSPNSATILFDQLWTPFLKIKDLFEINVDQPKNDREDYLEFLRTYAMNSFHKISYALIHRFRTIQPSAKCQNGISQMSNEVQGPKKLSMEHNLRSIKVTFKAIRDCGLGN
eukprot:TRINITY_DN113_c0_g1_i1.p1 TRINITY_DN113_c0_g1~~TRINITY_DN113_c0_g1_i1.p1  ORF type:complete len:192 (-),score=22.58 TRINITY_DN113_c0_g1_i1:113-688(-)